MEIIEKAKNFFHSEIEGWRLANTLKNHLKELNDWIELMLKRYPQADEEITLLGMWFHDIGFSVNDGGSDHAVMSESIARKWLEKEGYDMDKAEKVLHCVRAHRCKDIAPETIEARIIAFADSASHLTQGIYLDIVKEEKKGGTYDAFEKLERDWRDLSFFPEIKDEMGELYESWKKLIKAYKKMDI
jgi:hypothetical protein